MDQGNLFQRINMNPKVDDYHKFNSNNEFENERLNTNITFSEDSKMLDKDILNGGSMDYDLTGNLIIKTDRLTTLGSNLETNLKTIKEGSAEWDDDIFLSDMLKYDDLVFIKGEPVDNKSEIAKENNIILQPFVRIEKLSDDTIESYANSRERRKCNRSTFQRFLRSLVETRFPLVVVEKLSNEIFHEPRPIVRDRLKSCQAYETSRTRSKNTRKRRYSCNICNAKFVYEDTLRDHVKRKHLKLKNYVKNCSICGKNVKGRLSRHIALWHGKSHLTCDICGKPLSSKQALQVHLMSVHSNLKPFKCMECFRSFSNKFYLRYHVRFVHEKARPYKCMHCERAFSTSDSLVFHKRREHENKYDYPCNQCDKKFVAQQFLTAHINRIHLKKSQTSCPICAKVLLTSHSFKTHLKYVHRKVREFVCEICNSRFSMKSSIRDHIEVVHLKVRAFECAHCCVKFGRANYLALHIKNVHRKIKKFSCTMCDKSYKKKETLVHHMNVSHMHTVHNQDKKYVCDVCNSGFTVKATVKEHILHKHLKTYRNVCQFCKKSFLSNMNVKRHIRNVHIKKKNFQCLFCMKVNATEIALNEHLEKFHSPEAPQTI